MKKYKEIYSWNIFDKIKKGEKVYAVDRMLVEVFDVNSLDVDCFATLLARADIDKDRYLFWIVEEVSDND